MTDPADKHSAHKKIIIEGITEEGKQFRPSDWAERMSGSMCTFNNHRITYSPLLQPMVKGGHKCILLDTALQEENPEVYASVLEFARENKLKVDEEEEANTASDASDPTAVDKDVRP